MGVVRRRAFLAGLLVLPFVRKLPRPRAAPNVDYVHVREPTCVFSPAVIMQIQESMLRHVYRDALFPKLLFKEITDGEG